MRLSLFKFHLRERFFDLRYLRNKKFALAELSLIFLYLFCNPYRYCRKFLQKKGEQDIYAYGETPLRTLALIASKANIQPTDCFLELGSGRGRASLWVGAHIGCKVIGVEWIERFVNRSRLAAKWMKNVSFFCTELQNAPFEKASIVYLYGSSWSEELFDLLEKKMQALPKGAKIISISFPLKGFNRIESFPVRFPWGETSAYLLER